ncbi:hypothetical protein BJY04DRAFT_180114 [Aspergillus karnatakaensis]|uniref:uncharacterized protein n=1 Tax=Aspergillus karnatakaensis TaxID=1810916 RepID=UPI003CCDA68D
MTYTLNACIPCTTKKRKCDRRLPKCSTCARSKSNRECVYKNSVDGALVHSDPKLSPALSIRSGTSPQLQQLPKSPVACEKCRVGKRACSKDSPRCSRCERLNVSCNYEFARDLELKDHPETQNQLVRTKPHRSTLLLESPYGLPYKAQYPVPEQSHFRALIHTYSQTYWLPETHRAPNSLTTHLATVWMRRAMADPCLFHGTLFSASAHLDWVQGISHNPRTLYHQAQALTLLRERLQRDQICYETVATAEALIYYNMSAYNTESALVHKRGLLQMLAMNRDRGEDFGALTGLVNLSVYLFYLSSENLTELVAEYS